MFISLVTCGGPSKLDVSLAQALYKKQQKNTNPSRGAYGTIIDISAVSVGV